MFLFSKPNCETFTPAKATFYKIPSGSYVYLENKGSLGTVTFEGKLSSTETNTALKALTSKSDLKITHESRDRKGKQYKAITQVFEKDYPEKLTVPGSDFGDEFTLEFKSLTLWPRSDGTAYCLLRGDTKVVGRMNYIFCKNAIESLGNKLTFKGIETTNKWGRQLKLTSGVTVDAELPTLHITEDDFQPAADYKPDYSRSIPDELLADWDPKTSSPQTQRPAKSLKRAHDAPTSVAKRHEPQIPELFSDFIEL